MRMIVVWDSVSLQDTPHLKETAVDRLKAGNAHRDNGVALCATRRRRIRTAEVSGIHRKRGLCLRRKCRRRAGDDERDSRRKFGASRSTHDYGPTDSIWFRFVLEAAVSEGRASWES